MHKFLSFIFLVGIVGCSSSSFYTNPKSADDYFPIALSNAASGEYFNGLSASEVHSKRVNILIEFYSRPHLCHDFWKTRCLESELKLRNLAESYNKENNFIVENQELTTYRERWNNEYSQFFINAKKQKLEERKSICRTYGFKDETDGMGLCLIELDKLDALKKQISANNLAQSNLIAQQQEAAQAQALINLGAIIGGAGVPNNPQPMPSSPSYPESYSMSRTVPSNQNCPLLGVPLKKQEVKNENRICYY